MQISDSFLKQIYSINKHHEEIARLTGENFNVFRILGLSSDELSHTSFISSLLNPKGSHGRGEIFLKLFLEEVDINDFSTFNVEVKKENDIGPIDDKYENGGKIDILITDESKNQIVIENKIEAKDQKNQLLRYYNFIKKRKVFYLFYLTLNGTDASDYSLGDLNSESYIRISYRETILNWLERCKKESVSFPLLRETIFQYIILIKKITGQARSQIMTKEIIETIMSDTKNIESAFLIANNINKLKQEIIRTKLLPSLKQIAKKNELEYIETNDSYFKANWGFDFKRKEWKNYHLKFKFLSADFKDFIYGFYSDNDCINIHEALKGISDSEWTSGSKTRAYQFLKNYRNWNDEIFTMLTSENLENELLTLIDTKIKELLSLAEKLQKQGLIL